MSSLSSCRVCTICLMKYTVRVFMVPTLSLLVAAGVAISDDEVGIMTILSYKSMFAEGFVVLCGLVGPIISSRYVPIVGTFGCVFIDNETHESGVTKCTTGVAWSAFSWHHSSVFHCQWTHNQVFLLLSHMLIQNAKSIFIYVTKYMSGFIWKLRINFAVCIKWIDETWWNNRLLLVPNCYEVVAMVATMVAMIVPLWCHTLR